MTNIYRSKATLCQRTAQYKQNLSRGLLNCRKSKISITAKLNALRSQREREMGQAIRDDVPARTVASVTGVIVATTRVIGWQYADLSCSPTTAKSHLKTLRALTQQANRLYTEQIPIRREQERLVVTALRSGLLDPPWVAAVSGLT